jgi:hypothetical protein
MSSLNQEPDQTIVGDHAAQTPSPDTLNAKIGVLTRREVEARILGPVFEAFAQEFGRERVTEILRQTIIRIAQDQGEELAGQMGGDSLHHFADSMKYWTQNNALEIDLLQQSNEELDFNVTRCRYAELYRALGMEELGAVLSCNRDYALVEGFNTQIELTRTQTIMQGASHCDFRFHRKPADA